MAIVASTTAAYTWLFKFIIESMEGGGIGANAGDKALNFVKLVVPVVLGLTALSGICLFVQSILSNKVALNVVGGLQKSMFAALQKSDYEQLTKNSVGTHVSRFTNDVNVVASALLRAMNNLVRDVLTLILLVGAMFWHNWQLSLVVLLVYPLAIWPIIKISKKIRGTSHEAQAQMGRITSLLNESLSGTRMVRTYNLEDYEKKRLGGAFNERIRLYLKLVTNQARVDPVMEVLGGIAVAGVLAFGVYQMASGMTTGGKLVAVLAALGLAAPKARALGTLNNVVQEGLAALHRVFAVIDELPTITETQDAKTLENVKGGLEFNNVSFAYDDGTEAIRGLSFKVKPGETIALVGPSGGGKSTIINLIARLYDVAEGNIKIDGQDIKNVTLTSLRQAMALVSQDITLFDDTVTANISFGRMDANAEDIEGAAKAAAAHDFIMELSGGYQTKVGEAGGKLSGGQKQRIALARAMLRSAPILLLDEATSALDAENEAKVQSALNILTEGRTVFVIAHRLSTVKNADRIFVLDKGQIVENGNHQALMKKGGLYAKLRALQFS
ncbi:MAG: ABC transporter ATP-binding protein [Robiginitomaculum sp.]|nr:ABC transporter ATP-binding protein [Robiginitomaculum sp.]